MKHFLWALAIFSCATSVVLAADAEKTDVDKALERALEFLKSKQRADGAWDDNPAINGVIITAFMACGHLPGEGKYGEELAKGLEAVLKKQGPNGEYTDRGQMYGHGICTLMLAEVVGMSDNPRAKEALQKAIALTLKAQRVPKDPLNSGGWRYEPNSGDSDISVTAWQLLALRAAKNAGVEVPPDAIARAVAYIKRLAVSKGSGGGFGYQGPHGPNLARTGAGTLSLQLCGEFESEAAKAGADYIFKQKIEWGGEWYWYSIYYGAQASYQAGGKYWESWREKTEKLLLSKQREDGSWPFPPHDGGEERGGPLFPTAMAILALAVHYQYLPAYQR